MSWAVRLTAAAEDDVRQARQWYRERAPHVVDSLRYEVREALRRIGDNPWQYPAVHGGIRRALVHRFPYAVFYRVHAEAVQVIAVVHQARNPEVWKGRS